MLKQAPFAYYNETFWLFQNNYRMRFLFRVGIPKSTGIIFFSGLLGWIQLRCVWIFVCVFEFLVLIL